MIDLRNEDCTKGIFKLDKKSIDIIVTSPPYNIGLKYNSYKDKLKHSEYLKWMKKIANGCSLCLKPTGHLFLNVSGTPLRPLLAYEILQEYLKYFKVQNTIHWIKNISIKEDSYGHFKPITSNRFLNHTHEFIFHLTKDGNQKIDRLAVGVPFKDKSNIKRFKKNKQDKRCKGNCWMITYDTVNEKKIHPACVDLSTEILTNNGWKTFYEINDGDLCAQLIDGKISFDIINDIHFSDYNGVIYRFDGESLNFFVTENHKCIYQTKSFSKDRKIIISDYKEKLAKNLNYLKDVIPTACDWHEPIGMDVFDLDFASLVGWYLAEGYECKNSSNVEIYQSNTANFEYVNEIREILEKLGAEYQEATHERMWRGSKKISKTFKISGFIAHKLRQFFPNKKLNNDMLNWPTNILKSIINNFIKGDGSFREHGRKAFSQKDKVNTDILQAILFRLGTSSVMTYDEKNNINKVYTSPNYKYKGLKNKEGSAIITEDFEGKVWCPQTKNGNWVARRNGRIFLTGNSFPLQLPLDCIKLAGYDSDTIVLDPFLGSGTTALAAKNLGVNFIGFEIDEKYYEDSLERVGLTKV